MIQQLYGSHNTYEDLSWVGDDAVLWVKDRSGDTVLMAHLTNLAAFRTDGTIPDDESLTRDWLHGDDA